MTCGYLSGRKYHAATVTGKHIPNKEEAKELRRLMQLSGESEEEVRKKKSNRIKLAKASKRFGTGGNAFRLAFRKIRNEVALELGININDPRVEKAANTRLGRSSIHYSTTRFVRTIR
jgi:hypothetical protein